MNKQTIAQTLEKLMAARVVRGRPMSANELSRRTGVPQSTITRILNGDVKDPRTQQLQKIAGFFNVSIAELRGEAETPMLGEKPALDSGEVKEKFYQSYVTQLEMDLLTCYRSANDIGRRAIAAAVAALAKEYPAVAANNNNVRKLR